MKISHLPVLLLVCSGVPAFGEAPAITYLSDLKWDSAVATTSVDPRDKAGTVRKDQAHNQQAMAIDGYKYTKGLGAAGLSDISYTLDGSYDYFTSIVGLQDTPPADVIKGSVRFQIYSGDAATGKKLWDSGIMGNGPVTGRLYAKVPIKGVTKLTLHTDPVAWPDGYRWDFNNGPGTQYYPGNLNYWLYGGDTANWADAAIVKGTPAPITVTPHSTGYTPPSLGVGTAPGANVQKTMSLLTSSTPANKKTVKILVYGQSISRQDWWFDMAGKLERQYPNADSVIENHSWSGAYADNLAPLSKHDIYVGNPVDKSHPDAASQPDLVIMHDYPGSKIGSDGNLNILYPYYRQILKNIRAAAPNSEILLINDHLSGSDLRQSATAQAEQVAWCKTYLPAMAKDFNAGLIDMRQVFTDYYVAHPDPTFTCLTSDGQHLSNVGCALYAQTVESYLVPVPPTRTLKRTTPKR